MSGLGFGERALDGSGFVVVVFSSFWDLESSFAVAVSVRGPPNVSSGGGLAFEGEQFRALRCLSFVCRRSLSSKLVRVFNGSLEEYLMA